jgi:acyl-CoA thioesterase-1
MMKLLLAGHFALALILAGPNVARAESEKPVTIITIGDSLITSYGIYPSSGTFRSVLEQALIKSGHSAKVIDTGFRRTSETGLNWIQSSDGVKVLEYSSNTAAILELGSNDCNSFITLEQTSANLDKILETLFKRNIPVLLVGTTAYETCGAEYAASYPQIFIDLSIKYQALLYPDFKSAIIGKPELFQGDQNHPNTAGMLAVVQSMVPSVEALIAQIEQ